MRPLVVPFFIPHQGCPHRCVFCDQEKVAGARPVLPGTDELKERVALYAAGAPGRALEVAFYGGTFTALPRDCQERLLFPLQPLLRDGTVRSIRVSTRPDAVDDETVLFLERMGVATVELGVQSMDPEVLDASGRGHGADDVARAAAALRRRGIRVGIQLMPGLPGDTHERSLASLDSVLALRPSFLRIYPTLVIEGTELAARYRGGEYAPLSLEAAVSLCKEMLIRARRAGVPVIRMGLQPTAELDSPGVIVAGPYHPAFRQLVESELCYDLASLLAEGVPPGSSVSLFAPRGRLSDLVGQKRLNLERLSARFGITVAAAREDAALPAECARLEWEGGSVTGEFSRLFGDPRCAPMQPPPRPD